VPEAATFRVDLHGSRRAGVCRAAARLVTTLAAAACVLAVALAPSPLRLGAALASVGALLLALLAGRAPAARRLLIGADGTISVHTGGEDRPAAVRYAGRHLICLATADRLLAVWPDSVSATDWRRLLVACRWQRRPSGAFEAFRSGLRTK
jgi:hypothetical protein